MRRRVRKARQGEEREKNKISKKNHSLTIPPTLNRPTATDKKKTQFMFKKDVKNFHFKRSLSC